jgi:hypothetical protein
MARILSRRGAAPRLVTIRPEVKRVVVLWPGVLLPAIGLLGALGIGIAGLSSTLHLGAPNHSLGARWAGGEILVAGAWALYKAGSQRIVLTKDEMRIYAWAVYWRVPRGMVRDVQVRTRQTMSVTVVLLNGYEIQPMTFATRPGIGGANSLSRIAIRDRILQWNAGVAAPDSIPGREGGDRRYSGCAVMIWWC